MSSIPLEVLSELKHLFPSEIIDLKPDPEAAEYFGHHFSSVGRKYHFRIAKSTPTKAGHFVTFWKRTAEGPIAPFHINDSFDCLIIWAQNAEKKGFFVFTKETLTKRHFISTEIKEGKRGFRVYAPWVTTKSKQAMKSQAWQCDFFVDCSLGSEKKLR